MSKPAVLISGAGPSGLVLALTLAQNGVPVRIIDKDTTFHSGQRGSGIQPRTLEVFHFLGVLPDILARGSGKLIRCAYEMPGGIKPAKITDMSPHAEPTPSVPFRNPWMLGQGLNEEILRSHLAKYGVHVELGTELVGFEQNADSVTARLAHHVANQEDTTEAISVEFLVGAEGARSLVRKELGITFHGETREKDRLIIGDIEVEGLSKEYWHSWGNAGTSAVYLRPTERGNIFSLSVFGREVELDPLLASREALVQHIKNVTNRHELEFGELSWISEWRPNIRMADKLGEGRAFIIGDAAHVHPPTGGQGLNSGAQDAFNLGWKLALVHKGLAPRTLLESYTTERVPVIAEMLGRTTAILNATVALVDSPPASKTDSHTREQKGDHGKGDHGKGDKALSRPQILHQLGVNCRWSPVVVDEQPGAPAAAHAGAYLHEDPTALYAGDRAPDAPGLIRVGETETQSLFGIFGPKHHTVLIFASDAAAAEPTLAVLNTLSKGIVKSVVVLPKTAQVDKEVEGAELTLVDRDGYAYADYPPVAAGFHAIVVRPDGVVGAVVEGAEGLKRYLDGVFIRD